MPAGLDPLTARPPAGDAVDVSVCIANWNCRDLLLGCLESLHRRPQGVCLETVVVDNASTDGAPELVARAFPEVVLVRNAANVGFARANNQAAARARGRYLFFLNNDTQVPPWTLRRLLDWAEAHPEAGLIGPRLRGGDGAVQASCRPRPTLPALLHRNTLLRGTGLLRRAYRRFRERALVPDQPQRVDVLMGAAMFLRREVFFKCGPWDEDYTFGGEDLQLSTAIGERYEVVYLPTVEVIHFGRASSRRHVRYVAAHIPVGFLKYLRKGGCSRPALWLYKAAVSLDAPVQCIGKGAEYLWRRLRGRRDAAAKSLLACRGFWHFLTDGLVPFWRA